MPDALPGTTLPIYPGLGQAPNMLACIPGGLIRSIMLMFYAYSLLLMYYVCAEQCIKTAVSHHGEPA